MHPVLVILLAWLAVDTAVVALALASARHRSRRFEARMAEMLEQAEAHANAPAGRLGSTP